MDLCLVILDRTRMENLSGLKHLWIFYFLMRGFEDGLWIGLRLRLGFLT